MEAELVDLCFGCLVFFFFFFSFQSHLNLIRNVVELQLTYLGGWCLLADGLFSLNFSFFNGLLNSFPSQFCEPPGFICCLVQNWSQGNKVGTV